MNTAILFDTMSIQQYVFGSNKLKDNLGASYIVEHIYDYLENKSIDNPKDIEIGYVGGGNALFFTTTEEKAKEIIKDYTTYLLYSFPGISLAVAIKPVFNNKNYSSEIKLLFELLAENKGKSIPINTISSHGITDICRFSSLSVENIIELYDKEKNQKSNELISSVTITKRNYIEEVEKEGAKLLDLAGLSDYYTFTDEVDQLGLKKGEDSHIAVVHIDGNGFGKTFINLQSVAETKQLSEQVKEAVKKSFIDILQKYNENKEHLNSIVDIKRNKENKEVLPIRPIILGGDDVTFVCHGKLGIWFAEEYMESFNTYLVDGKFPFSSCAGVAIVKAKYPFYRAYELAEDLCDNAKKKNKKYDGNWIDFQLAYSGLSNTLEEVRELQYNVKGFNRPYSIEKGGVNNSITDLKEITAILKDTLPNSKIKDLRDMLTRDLTSLNDFKEHLKHQHPEFKKEFYNDNNEQEDKYPFFDMIELLELYPNNLLIGK